jgi:heme oxygenase
MYFIELSPGYYFAYNYRDGLGWLYLSEGSYPGGIYSYQYALWMLFVGSTGSEGAQRWFYDYTESTGADGYFSLGG